MQADRLEYFGTDQDQLDFFSKIDTILGLKIVESSFKKEIGPKIFDSLVKFLDFMRKDASLLERQEIYYGINDYRKLHVTNNIYSEKFASFDLIKNPNVMIFNYGWRLDDRRLLVSQIARSRESTEAKKLLSSIKKIAKELEGGTKVTVSRELVFQHALIFAKEGGRLVKNPESPQIYDSVVTL